MTGLCIQNLNRLLTFSKENFLKFIEKLFSFSNEDIVTAISGIKPNAALGPDEIPGILSKIVYNQLQFQKSHLTGYYVVWNCSVIL